MNTILQSLIQGHEQFFEAKIVGRNSKPSIRHLIDETYLFLVPIHKFLHSLLIVAFQAHCTFQAITYRLVQRYNASDQQRTRSRKCVLYRWR